ncbi:MAG: choice-of-anchor D domain-containing protein [Ignavibacteria bacterium]|nr:choice-of-anchor D domain-containing protein [Ignavibacteria bacterium]
MLTIIKLLIASLLCLACLHQANAQSITLFDVDTSKFPTMTGKIWAFDAAGNQQRPSASELSLTENGQPRTITSITCPPQQPPKALSVVLVIDVSGSMGSGYGSVPNIELAKSAARAWVNGLPLGESECAITSFDGSNYLNQDFTTDRDKLLNAISPLKPNGGTDYDAALINPMAGGLIVSKRGIHQKVIVFLTDGQGGGTESAIVAEANSQNCIVYCVTLGMPAPDILENIASRTGGQTYENVTTVEGAVDVYNRILQVAQRSTPCDITWTSGVSCIVGNTTIELSWQGQRSQTGYAPPSNAIASLKVAPTYVAFGKRLPATQNDTTLTLTAQNADFTVTGITRTFGSADITVVNTTFPLTIPQNTSRTITLRLVPSDSSHKYASFEIATDKCPGYFSANSGFPGKKATASTLKLTQPNGGEIYVVGSDTLISWTGIAPSDTVKLEYSVNNGITWKVITVKATGLNFTWKNVPRPPSAQCLVRVSQGGNTAATADTTGAILTLTGHTDQVIGVAFSPDGSRIATAGFDITAKIWDASTGGLIRTLIGHTTHVHGIAYSPDGSRIATSSFDQTAKIWDANSGASIRTLTGHTSYVSGAAFSPDGSTIATGSMDQTAKVWDANAGVLLRTLTGHTGGVRGVAFSPDGSRVATASDDNTAKIWGANTGVLIRTLTGHTSNLAGVAFSPDGSTIATASHDQTAKIWDANTGVLIRTLTGHTWYVFGVAFSPDGNRIATASRDSTAKIWDANTGALIRTLTGHSNSLTSVAFSPDERSIVTGSWDRTAKIWDIGQATSQSDVSDAVFSIVAPSPASEDVDMRQCLVGSDRDSLVSTFASNAGTYPYRVDSIAIVGSDASQFSLVSGIPPFTVQSSSSRAVEFRFSPTSIGTKTAQLIIFTQSDTLRQTIRGEGIAPSLAVISDVIDFGKLVVGGVKDTLRAITIKNIGSAPLSITATRHAGPNDFDFSTLAGGGSFTLAQGDTAKLDLRFLPSDLGRTSGRLLFEYNGVGSPATVQLFGEGTINSLDTARTTVVAQDIIAQAGERVNLTLSLQKQTGLQATGAPTKWFARIRYNSSILFVEQNGSECSGSADSCMLELSGTYNPASNELISVPCLATLGNTDNSSIIIDEFRWTNSGIVAETLTQNGRIRINGICDDGGARLYISAKNSTSLTTRPNPTQNTMEIHYGLREPLTITLELLNMMGQVVQTFVSNKAEAAGGYVHTTDVSAIGNGAYQLRMVTNKETLTTRVDVVR